MKNWFRLIFITALCIFSAVIFSAAASAVLYGDVVEPLGLVDAADARIVLRAAVELEQLSMEQRNLADMDQNDRIDSADARSILRTAVGLEAAKHYYMSEISIPAGCTQPGQRKFICTQCDDIIIEEIAPLGHDFSLPPRIITPFSCTQDGLAEYNCSRCAQQEQRVLPAAHTWTPVTCTQRQYCVVCGEKQGDALGHTTKIGYCENCGEYMSELETQATALRQKIETAIAAENKANTTLNEGINTSNPDFLVLFSLQSKNEYAIAYNHFVDAYYLCGDYADFSYSKQLITNIYKEIEKIRATPTLTAENFNSVIDIIDSCDDKISTYSAALSAETKKWQR